LLHRRASARVLTDVWREVGPDGKPYLVFRYLVIRLWKLPVEVFLNGPWAALPLVPLADVPSERLPEVVRAMDRRLRAEAPPADLGDIWTAALILIGLRLRRGEEIRTEISAKFTVGSLEEELAAAGMRLRSFHTDPDGLFGLSLSAPV